MSEPGDAAEVTRLLRGALLSIEEVRSDLLRLAAQVVAQGEELSRRLGPDDPDAIEAAIETRTLEIWHQLRAADGNAATRLRIGDAVDKYQVVQDDPPPCDQLLPICGARCCSFEFALSSQDLDEGVVRWDHGQPYLIAHDPHGWCAHLVRPGLTCSCYQQRPAPCRAFDCRDDPRVWVDYQQRILAPLDVAEKPESHFDLLERARLRDIALAAEATSVRKR